MTGEIEDLARSLAPMLAGAVAARKEAIRLLGETIPLHIHERADAASCAIRETAAGVFIPGEEKRCVMLLVPVPDPCLTADNLSGIVLAAFLSRELLRRRTRFSYHTLFLPPGTEADLSRYQSETGAEPLCAVLIRECAGAGPWSFSVTEKGHGLFFLLGDVFTQFGVQAKHTPLETAREPERALVAAYPGLPTLTVRKESRARAPSQEPHCDADALSRTLLLYLGILERLEDEDVPL